MLIARRTVDTSYSNSQKGFIYVMSIFIIGVYGPRAVRIPFVYIYIWRRLGTWYRVFQSCFMNSTCPSLQEWTQTFCAFTSTGVALSYEKIISVWRAWINEKWPHGRKYKVLAWVCIHCGTWLGNKDQITSYCYSQISKATFWVLHIFIVGFKVCVKMLFYLSLIGIFLLSGMC